jgi:peptide/nickel transport system permease protein
MIKAIVTRLGALIGVLLAVSALVFVLGSLVPGDLTSVIVGQEGATPEQYAEVSKRLGLDQPLYIQYVHWLALAVQGDFGTSPITGRNVSADLALQVPVSLELTALCLLLSTLLGLPAGVIAAVHANKRLDVMIRLFLLVMFSVPIFVIGVLVLLVSSQLAPDLLQVAYTPWSEDPVRHVVGLIMPLLTITLPITAQTMQMTRGAMLEVLSEPFIATARANGVVSRRIYYIHALRIAMPPIITFIGFQFGILLGGLIVIEQIFSIPGLGRGMLDAIATRDYPMVTATTLVFASAFVVINAIIDLLYPILDPRQRAR